MKIKDRWLILPSLFMFLYLVIRIIDYSKLAGIHPLSNIKHDIYSYAPLLYFLRECGFHTSCPYWYNGITTFTATPPGWYFFTLPFYYLTNKLLLSYYVSMVITFVLIFLAIWVLGKKIGLSKVQRFAFFAFIFGNNVMVNTLRLGRMPEIFAWLWFIITFLGIYFYKDYALDRKFYWLIIPYSLTLISYHSVGILLSTILVGFTFSNLQRNIVPVTIVMSSSFLATSFWWLPLLKQLSSTSIVGVLAGVEAWWMFNDELHFTSIAIFVLPLITFATAHLYINKTIKTNQRRESLWFFAPALFVVLLFFIGVLPFIPGVRQIFTNIYFIFMILLITIFIFETEWTQFKRLQRHTISTGILCAAIISIIISIYNTPPFDTPTQPQQDIAALLDSVNNPFLVVGSLTPINSHRAAFYSYGVIEKGLQTPDGHYPAEKEGEYVRGLVPLYQSIMENDCRTFKEKIQEYKAKDVLGYGPTCAKLKSCKLTEIKTKNEACLYREPAP